MLIDQHTTLEAPEDEVFRSGKIALIEISRTFDAKRTTLEVP